MLSALAAQRRAEEVTRRRHEEELARLKHEHAMNLRELTHEQRRLVQQIDALASSANNSELAVVSDC